MNLKFQILATSLVAGLALSACSKSGPAKSSSEESKQSALAPEILSLGEESSIDLSDEHAIRALAEQIQSKHESGEGLAVESELSVFATEVWAILTAQTMATEDAAKELNQKIQEIQASMPPNAIEFKMGSAQASAIGAILGGLASGAFFEIALNTLEPDASHHTIALHRRILQWKKIRDINQTYAKRDLLQRSLSELEYGRSLTRAQARAIEKIFSAEQKSAGMYDISWTSLLSGGFKTLQPNQQEQMNNELKRLSEGSIAKVTEKINEMNREKVTASLLREHKLLKRTGRNLLTAVGVGAALGVATVAFAETTEHEAAQNKEVSIKKEEIQRLSNSIKDLSAKNEVLKGALAELETQLSR